ncbi:MAG: hypothetical protein HXY20_12020 [Acidobacteria bacterium]|nr:hypothetical protein [Acidobacteriota bacterium]
MTALTYYDNVTGRQNLLWLRLLWVGAMGASSTGRTGRRLRGRNQIVAAGRDRA